MIEDGEISELCRICGKKDKYKCPQCETRTCSLTCCQEHKKLLNCQGIRDPTKFTGVITENIVQKDYNYVNTVMQTTETIQKKLVGITALPDAMRYKLLKHYARKINVDVILAPKIMKKHRENLSFYSIKDKQIHWCLELIILKKSVVTKPISQKTTIKDAILQQDLFDSNLLDQYKINTSKEQLNKYFEEDKIKISWQSYEVQEFTEQDEYKFKNQKRKLIQTNGQKKQTIFVDPDHSIEDVIKGYTVFEFPNDVDSRLRLYLEKRKSQQQNYAEQSTILFQDKAGLLIELDSLRTKNTILEKELKDLLQQYDELQKEEEIKRLEDEKAEILEFELEQLRQMNQKMKEEYQQQVDFLQKQLDLAEQEKIQLQIENEKLKSNSFQEQQTQELYNQVFSDGQDSQKFNKQIDKFKKEVQKLKNIVETKIVKKQSSKNKENKIVSIKNIKH